MTRVKLLADSGRIVEYRLGKDFRGSPPGSGHDFVRRAFAAAHVVADPRAEHDPSSDVAIDWDRTLAYRHHLWSHGFAVAEAMDTAQRGMGLDWPKALDLIRCSAREAKTVPGAVLGCGIGTDHLAPGATIDQVAAGYAMQAAAVEATGAQLIVMASRALAAVARGPEDYARVYGKLLSDARDPVILHWLGPMFDPALRGYWGSEDVAVAMDTCLSIIAENATKIDGIKISLLDADAEIAMRRRLPSNVRMYTGDDFNFPDLIAGDDHGYSDALLGIFDVIAPVAAAALSAQGAGDVVGFKELLAPTVPLSRHIFRSPTRFYKTGVVFMAYLNGYQDHFTMVGGQQSARSALHLSEIVRLADVAGLFEDPERVAERARVALAPMGIA